MKKVLLSGIIVGIFLTCYIIQNEASADQASGKPAWQYGSATSSIVCGDRLCSEIEQDTASETVQYSGYEIPSWIQTITGFWCDGIVNSEFSDTIRYLVDTGIIVGPETSSDSDETKKIPSWFKNNACWWVDGLISADDFFLGLEFLIKKGIIQV